MISGNAEITIRKATEVDLDALKILADAHRNELGFVRRPTLLEAIKREEIIIAQNGNRLFSFIHYHHRRDLQTTLYDIVVSPDQRLAGIGKALIEALMQEARLLGKRTILLKCPAGLPANEFYRHLGGQMVQTEPGKQRPLHVWQFIL